MADKRRQQRGGRWTRTAATALLILAGGAVLNVAVVMCVTVWPQTAAAVSREVLFSSDDDPSWRMVRARGVAFDRLVWSPSLFRNSPGEDWNLSRALGIAPPPVLMELPNWSRLDLGQQPERDDHFKFFIEDARGWPMLAMLSMTTDSSKTWVRTPDGVISTDGLIVDAQNAKAANLWTVRILPLRPLWRGFIINTLFYAALIWPLFLAPFAARRMIRRGRGQCEKCAYPIGVSSVCTECGAAIERPRRADA